MDIRVFDFKGIFFPIISGDPSLGRTLGRNLRWALANGKVPVHVQQDFQRSVHKIFATSSTDIIFLPVGTPLETVCSLSDSVATCACALSFVFWDEGTPPGFAVIREGRLPPTLVDIPWDNASVLAEISMDIKKLMLRTFNLINVGMASLDVEVQALVFLYLGSAFNSTSNITCLVIDFIGSTSMCDFSRERWTWLLNRSVLSVPLGSSIVSKLQCPDLLAEISREDYTNFGNRKHKLVGFSAGHVYFWGNATPLVSTEYGEHMFDLTVSLVDTFRWLESLRECLVTLYARHKDHLNFHSDVFDGSSECVVLFFIGEKRDLFFRISGTTATIATIKCTSDKCVIITPLANTVFEHAKGLCVGESGRSLSLAYRSGLPLSEACRKYKHIRRRLGIDRSVLAALSALGLYPPP